MAYVYCNEGETPAALARCHSEAKTFSDLNREQEGDIVHDYYLALKQAQDLAAWDPYLQEIRQAKT